MNVWTHLVNFEEHPTVTSAKRRPKIHVNGAVYIFPLFSSILQKDITCHVSDRQERILSRACTCTITDGGQHDSTRVPCQNYDLHVTRGRTIVPTSSFHNLANLHSSLYFFSFFSFFLSFDFHEKSRGNMSRVFHLERLWRI